VQESAPVDMAIVVPAQASTLQLPRDWLDMSYRQRRRWVFEHEAELEAIPIDVKTRSPGFIGASARKMSTRLPTATYRMVGRHILHRDRQGLKHDFDVLYARISSEDSAHVAFVPKELDDLLPYYRTVGAAGLEASSACFAPLSQVERSPVVLRQVFVQLVDAVMEQDKALNLDLIPWARHFGIPRCRNISALAVPDQRTKQSEKEHLEDLLDVLTEEGFIADDNPIQPLLGDFVVTIPSQQAASAESQQSMPLDDHDMAASELTLITCRSSAV
jgi:hypothetical protein